MDPEEDDGSDLMGGLAVRPADQTPGVSPYLSTQRRNLQALYDQAAARLASDYRTSARNETLLALGAALLKPTEGGTFAESLGNASQALLDVRRTNRDREEERQAALLKLMGQYDVAAARGSQGTTLQRDYQWLLENHPELAPSYLKAKADPVQYVMTTDAYGRPVAAMVPRSGATPAAPDALPPPVDRSTWDAH